ncbi:carbohydrate ABC transporter permease [Lacticaseibacillus mingshuiensis]|uniref:Carbohydrate ABC transporter permease n=1 Tax=Lacticaseibacillus mingshuiensis TaxID=2799574 RepID=A0ABW4CHV3_9LACO|nr:sugar ABC transporter permease [Lacticaseibacillus mingshuiensis]
MEETAASKPLKPNPRRRSHALLTTRDKVQLVAMSSPAIVIYTAFLVIPIFIALYFSFHSWNGIKGAPLEYVGWQNFARAFASPLFQTSMKNLALMVTVSVLFHTPIALVLAAVLNTKVRGKRFFKMIYFVPTIFPLIATGLLWYFIFMPTGALNTTLTNLGLGSWARGWLVDSGTAMPTIIFVNIWAGIGYYMIILLAGLKNIPEDVYEAARIDGASAVQIFFRVTVPIMRPTILLCLVLDIIGTIKVFDLVFVMTGGGPNGLTNLPTTLVYYEAFRYDNYGLGSAVGVILLVLAMTLTLLTQYVPKWIARKRVKTHA